MMPVRPVTMLGTVAQLLVRTRLLLALAATATACTAITPSTPLPAWLQAKIAEFERLPPAGAPREILRANFSGRPVYYVAPRCCDIPSELYEESGQLICHPDGGFAGGDGRCPAFALPPNSVTVWRAAAAPARTPASAGQ